ncbi:DUF2935 domain-containing protein [Anaeroselena agilis]|uniref:DUF2935 domain-containing protein n=1 Tax=Anaeroselena agilis TaxID=3063788 RepID=A0ABU3P293_9FIRM|nr:DUF2935 domain-containing protein [Selenomonadales bacterium 4137-cl]
MPRPKVVNDKRQPVPPLNLEELKFWLRIMEEHAQFIKAGLPCDSIVLIGEADNFQQEFAALRVRAEQVQNQRQFTELVDATQTVVGEFYRYKRRLLQMELTCQLLGCNFALFLDHVSREAEYFLMLLSAMGSGRLLYQSAGAREVTFWLRLMADHSRFIVHRLDPSERAMVETAEGFACEFDALYLQGRDFVSMLRGSTNEVPAFRRFLQDVRVSTLKLRDFKRAVESLIAECRLVGLIPALLADHVRREADHFLLVLAILEKGTFVPYDEDGELEFAALEETAVMAAGGAVAVAAAELAQNPAVVYYDDEDEDDDEEYGGRDDEDNDGEDEEDGEREDAPLPTTPPPPEPPAKPAKVKWSGKWPRPLGAQK